MSAKMISRRAVLEKLAGELRSPNIDNPIRLALFSEFVRRRVELDAAVRDEGDTRSGTHTKRLLAAIRHQYGLLWQPAHEYNLSDAHLEDLVDPKGVLDILGDIGDIYHTGKGYWIRVPARFIPVAHTEDYFLVVGSTPSYVLEEQFGVRVRTFGCARYLDGSGTEGIRPEGPADIQLFESWLQTPVMSLREWTQSTLSRLHSEMSNSEMIDIDEIEVYWPAGIFGGQRIQPRWYSLREIVGGVGSKQVLCRLKKRHRSYGPSPKFLARLSWVGQRPSISRLTTITEEIYRRLIYGIDQIENAPIRVKLQARTDACTLDLPRFLPESERKILSLAFQQQNSDGDDQNRVYIFPPWLKGAVIRVLDSLGIRVDVTTG